MGLDQYLTRRKHVKSVDNEDCSRIEVMTWRKANMVQNFFEKHVEVENCQDVEVSEALLEDLLIRCDKILKDKNLASILLPTTSGFFFGSTDYDEWYFDDLKETSEELTKILEHDLEDDEDYVYHCWW